MDKGLVDLLTLIKATDPTVLDDADDFYKVLLDVYQRLHKQDTKFVCWEVALGSLIYTIMKKHAEVCAKGGLSNPAETLPIIRQYFCDMVDAAIAAGKGQVN